MIGTGDACICTYYVIPLCLHPSAPRRALARTGTCSLTAFGAATGHDRTTLNRTVGALEREGLVRSCAGTDKRQRMVSLTDAGRAAIDRASPLWESAQAEMAREVDTAALFALLDRIESAAHA